MGKTNFNGCLVGGSPSSGSTLLSMILDSHSDVLCGPETTFFTHPLLWESANFTKANAYLAWFSREQSAQMLSWTSADQKVLQYYLTNLTELMSLVGRSHDLYEFGEEFMQPRLYKDGAMLWIEKTPQNIYALSTFLTGNRQAKAIIIIRDPRAVMDSLVRRNFHPDIAARIWCFEAAITFFLLQEEDIKKNILLIRYENLVISPERVVEKICDFLGIKYEVTRMIQHRNTPRLSEDFSLQDKLGSAVSAWKCQPNQEISTEPLTAWRENLSAEFFGYIVRTQISAEALRPYTCHAEKISSLELMDYFGYYSISSPSNNGSPLSSFFKQNVELKDSFLSGERYFSKGNAYSISVRPKNIEQTDKEVVVNFIKSIIEKNKLLQGTTNHLIERLSVIPKVKKRINRITKNHWPFKNYTDDHCWIAPHYVGKYDVVVAIAFQGRQDVLYSVIWELMKANNMGIKVGVVLAASDKEDVYFATALQNESEYIGICECENKPLGNKWHLAVQCARKLNPKVLMITGSDDLVSSKYICNNYSILCGDTLNTLAMAGPRVWYMFEFIPYQPVRTLKLWRISYHNSGHRMPLGAGRMYTDEFLDSVNWEIFERHLNILLDGQGYDLVKKMNKQIYNPTLDDGFVVSVKGTWGCLNPIEKILKAPTINVNRIADEEYNRVIELVSESIKRMQNCHLSVSG